MRFDAQAKLDEIEARFGDQVKIYVKKIGWSGIKEVDISLTGKNILPVDLEWFLNKIQGIPLGSLKFIDCKNMQAIDLSRFYALKNIVLKHCDALKTIKGLDNLKDLIRFKVEDCDALKKIDGLGQCKCLKSIDICGAGLLQNFPDLSGLSSLVSLKLKECYSMDAIPGLLNLKNLERLVISNMDYDFFVPDLSSLVELRNLYIETSNYSGIEIFGLSKLTKLEKLEVRHCGQLINVKDLSELKLLKSLVILDDECNDPVGLSLLNHPNVTTLDIASFVEGMDISGAINLEYLSLRCSNCDLDLSNMIKLKKVKIAYDETEY